jgi:hypothetical protein
MILRKLTIFCVSAAILGCIAGSSTFAETNSAGEPDSVYVDEGRRPQQDEGGGLLDFLPFFGRRAKEVEPEKLSPSPRPEKTQPGLSAREMDQLRQAATDWLLTSEFTEPTLRQDEEGEYYRDYTVFADEYDIAVLRGESQEQPFIGRVTIKGDYFRTKPHELMEAAQSDYDFDYQSREFRIIFSRVEKWEYSDDPREEAVVFKEEWAFSAMQSRLDMSRSGETSLPSVTPPATDDAAEPESVPE